MKRSDSRRNVKAAIPSTRSAKPAASGPSFALLLLKLGTWFLFLAGESNSSLWQSQFVVVVVVFVVFDTKPHMCQCLTIAASLSLMLMPVWSRCPHDATTLGDCFKISLDDCSSCPSRVATTGIDSSDNLRPTVAIPIQAVATRPIYPSLLVTPRHEPGAAASPAPWGEPPDDGGRLRPRARC